MKARLNVVIKLEIPCCRYCTYQDWWLFYYVWL